MLSIFAVNSGCSEHHPSSHLSVALHAILWPPQATSKHFFFLWLPFRSSNGVCLRWFSNGKSTIWWIYSVYLLFLEDLLSKSIVTWALDPESIAPLLWGLSFFWEILVGTNGWHRISKTRHTGQEWVNVIHEHQLSVGVVRGFWLISTWAVFKTLVAWCLWILLANTLGISRSIWRIPISKSVKRDTGIWTLTWGFLVGGFEHEFYDFPYIGNVIIPNDFHIFQRGRYTANQLSIRLLLT